MIRAAIPSVSRIAALAAVVVGLAACATTEDVVSPPVSEIRPSVGEASQANWEAGQAAYLAWSGARRGWTTTDSGLQYKRVGPAKPDGKQPAATDTVRVHYRGTFIDGREFDSSYARNEPAEFPLNRVIPGWTEGAALMREGEAFDFVLPGNIAYGARGAGGGEIPPNSALLFRVELLEVK